jgi:hypothetical protein
MDHAGRFFKGLLDAGGEIVQDEERWPPLTTRPVERMAELATREVLRIWFGEISA